MDLEEGVNRPERKKGLCRVKRMPGISESKLWLIIGKTIRNDSGNGHVVRIDKIMVSPIELFKCCYQFGFLTT